MMESLMNTLHSLKTVVGMLMSLAVNVAIVYGCLEAVLVH